MTENNPKSPACRFFEAVFKGTPLTVIELRGVAYYVAIEFGDLLGYARGGRAMTTLMASDWSERLQESRDYVILTGPDLALVKQALKATDANSHGNPCRVDPRAPSLLLLTREGANRILTISGKPVAIEVQDWLASEVMRDIQDTGTYTVGGDKPKIEGPPLSLDERRTRVAEMNAYLRGAVHLHRAHPGNPELEAELMSRYLSVALGRPTTLAIEEERQEPLFKRPAMHFENPAGAS